MSGNREPEASSSTEEEERDWLFLLLAAIGGTAMCVPLFSSTLLPLLDWPQHNAMVASIANAGSPEFEPYILRHYQISTYLGFYYPAALLSKLVGADMALRLLMTIYFGGTPFALGALFRSLGRSPYPALLCFPMLWGYAAYLGFGAFLLGFPFAFLTLAQCFSIERAGEATREDLIRLLSLTCVLFFIHALLFAVTLLVAGIALLPILAPSKRKLFPRYVMGIGPSVGIFLIWVFRGHSSDLLDRLGVGMAQIHANNAGDTTFEPLQRSIERWPEVIDAGLDGGVGREILLAWVVAGAVMFVASLLARKSWKKGWRPGYTEVVVVASFLAAYLFLPVMAVNVWAISKRFGTLGPMLIGLLFPAVSYRRSVQLAVATPALFAALFTAHVHHERFAEMDEVGEALLEVIDAAEPGRRLYGLPATPRHPGFKAPVLLHAASYYVSRRGGLAGFSFIHSPTVPLSLQRPGINPYPGVRGEWFSSDTHYELYSDYYDYFLARGASVPRLMRARGERHLRQVARSGGWVLYEDLAPRLRVVHSFHETLHRAEVSLAGESCGDFDGTEFSCPGVRIYPETGLFRRTHIMCTAIQSLRPDQPVEFRFRDLPDSGTQIRGMVGIDDRSPTRGGVSMEWSTIRDGEESSLGARIESGDEAGYRTFMLDRQPGDSEVIVRVRSQAPGAQTFCWNASLFEAWQ